MDFSDSVRSVACRLAEVKVRTGSRSKMKAVLCEGEKWLHSKKQRVDSEDDSMMHLQTLARSSLAEAIKEALDYRDYRAAAALAWIDRPAARLSQSKCSAVLDGGSTFEKICLFIAYRRWIDVIKLWPKSDWFHLLLLLLGRVSAQQMNAVVGHLSHSIPSNVAVIPAIIAGDSAKLGELGEHSFVQLLRSLPTTESHDTDSEVTEDADDQEEDESDHKLSQQDQYCVDVWLNFVEALNNGLKKSIANNWRCYGITTTIENVLVPLLEQQALSTVTLTVLYELTSQVQSGRFESCRSVFAKLASTADFAQVTTFLPALRRAVAIAASTDTLSSS